MGVDAQLSLDGESLEFAARLERDKRDFHGSHTDAEPDLMGLIIVPDDILAVSSEAVLDCWMMPLQAPSKGI